MRKLLKVIIIILLIPIYLILFTIVHELGHTLLARLMGDPASIFYLVRMDGDYLCLGCNIYDQSRLTWGANLVVSLGGLLATQIVAITALFLLRLRINTRYTRRILGFISLGFAFLDVIVQAAQGLLYNLNHFTFPSNIDLVDAMLLVQQRTGASQFLLKAILVVLAVVYLSAFIGVYWRNRWAHNRQM
jgi:hypothetical protein